MSRTLLIKNISNLVSCDLKDTEYTNAFIYAENGLIKDIGPMSSMKDSYNSSQNIIDATDKVVYPGLINCHHHLYQTLSRNLPETQNMELFEWLDYLFKIWERIDDDVVYYSSMIGLSELLKTGCTTTVDHMDSMVKGKSKNFVKMGFDAAEKLGIRLCMTRGSIDLTKEDGGNIPEGLVQTIEETLAESEDAINKFHDNSLNSMRNVILAPCSPFCCTKELMKKTVELARRKGVRMHTHLCETKDEENWTLEKYKKRPLELMQEVGLIGEDVFYAHGIHFTDEEIKILAQTKTGVSHCPISNMKLSSGIMKIKEMRKFGVNIGLGVDGSASNDGSNMLEEMRVCFLLHRLNESHEAPKGYDILKIATNGGAKLIGRKELGALSKGMACDLFMINKKKIEMVGCDYDFKSYLCTVGHKGYVDMTIVNGKVVFKDGKLVNIDEEKIMEKAKEVEEKYLHGSK